MTSGSSADRYGCIMISCSVINKSFEKSLPFRSISPSKQISACSLRILKFLNFLSYSVVLARNSYRLGSISYPSGIIGSFESSSSSRRSYCSSGSSSSSISSSPMTSFCSVLSKYTTSKWPIYPLKIICFLNNL